MRSRVRAPPPLQRGGLLWRDKGAELNIYLVTELAGRELWGNVLIGVVAALRGHSVHILDQRDLPLIQSRVGLKPGIFHTKSLHSEGTMNEFLEVIAGSGLRITSLDQEGGLIEPDLFEKWAETRFSAKTVERASMVFAWGDMDFDYLTRRFPEFAGKIFKLGLPRADLWGEKFAPLRELVPTASRKRVLISSNFGINSFNRHWEIYSGLRDSGALKEFEGYSEYFFQNAAESMVLEGHLVRLLDQLSISFADVEFVIRPHPVEDVNAWKSLLPRRENLRVDNSSSLIAWIHSSDLLIQSGCTSALEASRANRPVISWVPTEATTISKFANSFGVECRTFEEVADHLRAALFDDRDHVDVRDAKISEELRATVGPHRGELTSVSLIKMWEKLNESAHSETPNNLLGISFWGGLGAVRRRLSKVFGHRRLEKFPNVELRNIRTLVQLYCGILGKTHIPRVRRLYSGGLVIAP